MEENKEIERKEIFSERVRAGKRTYFFDVKATRANDYYLTITESKRRYKDDGYTYEKHKIFLYKEDFNKFVKALNTAVGYVKEELLPDVDFEQFDSKPEATERSAGTNKTAVAVSEESHEVAEETIEIADNSEGSSADTDLKWD